MCGDTDRRHARTTGKDAAIVPYLEKYASERKPRQAPPGLLDCRPTDGEWAGAHD